MFYKLFTVFPLQRGFESVATIRKRLLSRIVGDVFMPFFGHLYLYYMLLCAVVVILTQWYNYAGEKIPQSGNLKRG